MTFPVRPARSDDKAAIAAFTAATFEWGDYVAGVFDDWLVDPEALTVVAVDAGDQPVGLLRTLMLSPQEAWLHAARVHPDHRRHGIGKTLNDFGVAWARRRGALVARLMVEEWNQAAQTQVVSLGYRPVARFMHAKLDHPASSLGAEERLRVAHRSEVEVAWAAWETSPLAAAAHRLHALGWHFRSIRITDLERAAKAGRLLVAPSGWTIVDIDEEGTFVSWLTTTAEEAGRLVAALLDRAAGLPPLEVMVPQVGWLDQALSAAGVVPSPALVFEKAL